MRREFILPGLLAAALAVMVAYATTKDENPPLATQPAQCTDATMVAALRDLPEASGLAKSRRTPDLYWAHNDSAEPLIVGVAANGQVRARVRVAGASVADWEAVTTSSCESGDCLFIGDIGDNDRARRSIVVFRTTEPVPGDEVTANATAVEGVYPEGPQDAEALFADGQTLFVVTKGEGAPVRLYRYPALTPGRHTLQLVATLTANVPERDFRVTDAALAPDHRWVALRTNDLLLFFDAQKLLAGAPSAPLAYDLRGLNEPQGEGLAWSDAHTLMLAGEGDSAGTFARISCNLPS
jgi:hypothetical protein